MSNAAQTLENQRAAIEEGTTNMHTRSQQPHDLLTHDYSPEHICAKDECGATENLTQLACFGGAAGIAFACPPHYIEHLQGGGVDEEGNDGIPCQQCLAPHKKCACSNAQVDPDDWNYCPHGERDCTAVATQAWLLVANDDLYEREPEHLCDVCSETLAQGNPDPDESGYGWWEKYVE